MPFNMRTYNRLNPNIQSSLNHRTQLPRLSEAGSTTANENLGGALSNLPVSLQSPLIKKTNFINLMKEISKEKRTGIWLNIKEATLIAQSYKEKGINLYINGSINNSNKSHTKINCALQPSDIPSVESKKRHQDEGESSCHQTNNKIIKLDNKIQGEEYEFQGIEYKDITQPDNNLTKEYQELKSLADSKNGFAGYLYTAGCEDGNVHFDLYLTTPQGEIIEAIPYGCRIVNPYQRAPGTALYPVEASRIYTADVGPLVSVQKKVSTTEEKRFSPHAGRVECVALCLAYAKEYLKKHNGQDSDQLKSKSLLINHNMGGGNIKFHLPSPEVLRYSHSKEYNNLIYEMVTGKEDYVEIENEKYSYKVITLKGIQNLKGTIKRLDSSIALNEKELSNFSGLWIKEYHEAMKKRDVFSVDGKNLYPQYLSFRYAAKADDLLKNSAEGSFA